MIGLTLLEKVSFVPTGMYRYRGTGNCGTSTGTGTVPVKGLFLIVLAIYIMKTIYYVPVERREACMMCACVSYR
jgi:hypothetical protein